MSQAFNALPADYLMDAIVITEAGVEDVDDFSAPEFGIDPLLEVEVREDYYGDSERRVPAMLIESAAPDTDGEFVAAVLTLADYKLL